MSDKQPKAWTDEQIATFANNAPSAWEARRLYDAMRKVRDDLQQQIDALRGELAQARAWEVGDLEFACGAALIAQIGDEMFVNLYGETLQIDLPEHIRFCRRAATAPGTGAQEVDANE